jgi:hypothetical protein
MKKSKFGSKPDTFHSRDVSPDNMYAAVEFGSGRPDAMRRYSGNYGKTAKKRGEYKPEVGMNSSLTARIFNAIKR